MPRQLRTITVYALWGLAAAGILAVVLYIALARGGAASNPEDIVAEDAAAATPAPAEPTPTPADSLAGAPDNTIGMPDRIALDVYRYGRAPNAFSIGIYWSQVSGAVRYDVERDLGDGYESLGWIDAALVSEILNVAAPARVSYRVRACADEAGADCGLWGVTAPVPLQPLLTPTGLAAAAAHQRFGNTFSVDLSWGALDMGRRYEVEREMGAGWARIGQVYHPTSTYADRVVAPQAVTVQYRVSNCEDDACSPASDTVAVDLAPIPAPPAPSLSGYYGAVGEEKQQRQGTDLIWTAAGVGDAGGHFSIGRRPAGQEWGHLRQIEWAAGEAAPTAYTHEIYAAETPFQMEYRIRACNPGGCSDWSNTVAVTVTTRNGGGN